jgi:hypothetical protein
VPAKSEVGLFWLMRPINTRSTSPARADQIQSVSASSFFEDFFFIGICAHAFEWAVALERLGLVLGLDASVCMYIRMYVCIYVCMYVYTYVCMYVYTYACMYVYI